MQKLTFKSEKTNEELILSFGLLMDTVRLPKEEQLKVLLDQSNFNADALEKHFKKNPGDKISLVTISSVD